MSLPVVLTQLLFLSGYYHAVIGGESTRPYRERVVDKIQYGARERLHLWLLGRCHFASSFQIQGFSVEPFTDEQLERLGPDPRIQKNVWISRSSYRKDETKRWWLVFRERVENGMDRQARLGGKERKMGGGQPGPGAHKTGGGN